MKLRVVSPIVVPTHGGLRVAPRLGLIFAQLRALTATWRLLWGRRQSNGERMGFNWYTRRGGKLIEVLGKRRLCISSCGWLLRRTGDDDRLWLVV
jgi:hypothetical protein